MSILTKIFVVLTTIFALLLVAAIVPYVQMTSKIKAQWIEDKEQLAIAKQRASLLESGLEITVSDLTGKLAAQTEELAKIRNDIKEKQSLIQNQEVALMELRNDKVDVEAKNSELASALDQAQKIMETQATEIKERREQMILQKQNIIDLNRQLSEKTTESDMMTQQVRLYEEKIRELEAVNEDLGGKVDDLMARIDKSGMGTQDEQLPPPPPTQPIRGVITDVQKIDSEIFAAVNVGTNDKVAEGMEFIIYKGTQFMGNLTITKVDLQSSAGRVSLPQGEITENLEVLAGGM